MLSAIVSVIIVINELMASNAGMVMSPATNFDSWIELYNPSDQEVNLAGFYLSNDESNPMKWQMPDDIGSVPAQGFKVIWLGSNNIKETQAPFKLDCDGGDIFLSDATGALVTHIKYPEALSRTSYARTTDGGNVWGWTASPTPEATNATSVIASNRLSAPVVSEGSQLINGSLTVKVDIPEGAKLMYTTDGSMPTYVETSGEDVEEPYWRNWVKNSDCEGADATCFVCRDGDGDGDVARIVDGVGALVDGVASRGAKVHSIAKATNDWDSQFFVYTPDHVWTANETFHFRMKVRADKASHISVQSHRTPGDYIHWQMLSGGYNVTTEWQEITYDGTITAEQAGASGLQAIAFNLNEKKEDNNFYFDEIVWESYYDPNGTSNGGSRQSKDGLFTVNNTTNYVFRLFQDGYLPSVPVSRSYIKPDNNYTIPIVSVIGDDRYFNDPMWGIDVKGTNGIPGNGSDEAVNWNMDWDRPVNFSYIDPNEGMLFNQDVNISVSGGWTRGAPPRSMKLKSSKIFDGLNRFNYSFFPQKPFIRNKAILVRNGGNDVWNNHARFTDPALGTIIQRSGIDLDVQSLVQVVEYLNGKFKGVLNLREVTNDKFVYANYGYDDDEIDMFENDEYNNGDNEAFDRLWQLAKNINDVGAYEEVKRLLDVDEFANYMAVEIFLGNDDWPENNVKAYRSRNDGRYRYICFDLDYTFNPWGRNNFTQVLDDHNYIGTVSLFLNLLNNEEFRRKFIDTYCIVAGSVFEKNRATAIVKELADAMRPMSQLDGYLPDNAANKIIDQLKTRMETMMTRAKQYAPMGVSSVNTPYVTLASDVEGASIFINGINVPYASFDGRLFEPVTLEAKAPAGYTFAGWKKSSGAGLQMINANDTWKYYDQGQQEGTDWQLGSYDDDSWASGDAPFGYKMSGVKTTVSYGNDAQNKYPTTYFRKKITLRGAPTSSDTFTLKYQVDDGFIIWINGKDAGRVNMPDGNVGFNTFSTTYAGDTPMTGTITLPPSLFKRGINIIAIEVHNNSATSSDLFFTCELTTTVGADTDGDVQTNPVINLTSGDKHSLIASFTPMSEAERAAKGFTPVCINEVSAANNIHVNDYFKRNDWVELYNTTDADIDVEGMYLSDKADNPKKYQISGEGVSTIIPAHGYLIVWCDKLEPLSQLHAAFKLDADGGDVILTAEDESWSNRLTYPAMNADETVGRYPDGTANVFTMNVPTIAKTNILSSYATAVEQSDETAVRNLMAEATDDLSLRYVVGRIIVESPLTSNLQIRVVTLAGQLVMSLPASLSGGYAEVSVEQLPAGVYIASATDNQGHKATCKFIKR